MDLYLPDEFYALSESPNPHRDHAVAVRDDMLWLGAEASVAPLPETEEAGPAPPAPPRVRPARVLSAVTLHDARLRRRRRRRASWR